MIAVSVVDDAGIPLADARVLLTGQGDALHRVTASDDRGQAAFEDLPAGAYVVAAEKRGFVKSAFGQLGPIDATVISLADGESFAARIPLIRTGSITGTVTNERGAAIQARVSLHRVGRERDRRTLKLLSATQTDLQGAYRLDEVAPGEYLVSADAAARDAATPASGQGPATTVPVFYPSAIDPVLATPVRVAAGGSSPGVNLQVLPVPPGRLEGVVLNVQGQTAGDTSVHITRSDELDAGGSLARSNAAGEFRFVVPPGTYRVTSQTGARAEVIAVSGVTTPVTVKEERSGSVSGRVEFAGGPLTGRIPAGTTAAELIARGSPFPMIPLAIGGGDYSLRTVRLTPGDYVVRTSSGAQALAGWALESISVSGRPTVDAILRVQPDDNLSVAITLTNRSTELTGTVVDRQQRPRYDHQILVFASDPELWVVDSWRVRLVQPDTKGRFRVPGLPPGDYFVSAISGSTGGWDKALLESAASAAVRVQLERGTVVVQNVMIGK